MKHIQNCSNFFLNNPYQIVYETMIEALRDGSEVSPIKKLTAAQKVTLEDLIEFGKKWSKQVYSEIYIAGNMSEEEG